jgi:Uma2 family endonuclease
MGHAALELRMTAADFLAWEARQETKHEFVQGEVFAMAGAGKAHVAVTLNTAFALRQHLRGTPCRVFASDTRLHLDAAGAYVYPDVVVTCSERDAGDPVAVREPTVLVEVLSFGTSAYDRGLKFTLYRELPSLREVVLIDPKTRRTDLFRKRESDGVWELHPAGPGEGFRLASLDFDVPREELWFEVPEVGEEPAPPAEAPRRD